MKITSLLIVFILWFIHMDMQAQHENDVWITGYPAYNDTTDYPDTGINKIFGNTFIDFRKSPYKRTRNQKGLVFDVLNVSICDSAGDLLLYSNGYKLFNKYHKLIEGGDSLGNSSQFPDPTKDGYYGSSRYGRANDRMLVLPRPNYPYQYYVFNFHMNYDTWRIKGEYHYYNFYYSLVDIKANNGYGKVIIREKQILKGDFNPTIAASKHANGKDWWIVLTDRQYLGGRKIYKVLVGSEKLEEQASTDSLLVSSESIGSKFSLDGKHYTIAGIAGIMLYDFNRCTGKLSNGKIANYSEISDTSLPQYPCFSPNGKYIYLTLGGYVLYQFDVFNNFESSRMIVSKSDYKQDSLTLGYTSFHSLQYTPDRKRIIISSWINRFMHIIDSPDKRGSSCMVRLNEITLPTFCTSIPHFPNYTLGPDSCGMHSSLSVNEDHPEITIYPNPAQEEIRVSISSILYKHFLTNEVTIHIFDINGRSVFQMKIPKHQTEDVRIETTKLQNGVYYLECIDAKNFLSQKKNFIISH